MSAISTPELRSIVNEAGIPQPDRIFSDKRAKGRRFKLVWTQPGAVLTGIHTKEGLELVAESYEQKLQPLLPDTTVIGAVVHGFMYGYDINVTIYEGKATPGTPSLLARFHRKYGYTQG